MKIILVNGMPESGKTTFEKLLKLYGLHICHLNVNILSSITPIKEIAKEIGWKGTKTPKDRKFLSDLKDLCTEYNDYPVYWLRSKIIAIDEFHCGNMIFLVDIREPDEIERLKKEWNAKALLMRRAAVENNRQSNHADMNVFNCEYDYIIENNGTEEDLRKKAKEFIVEIKNEEWESKVK